MIDESRRRFMHFCSATALLFGTSLKAQAENRQPLMPFARVLLVDKQGTSLHCEALEAEREYVFFYPYASTPCFLLNLGKPTAEAVDLQTADGQGYRWTGGVGPHRSVVAFSAICAHRMTHPSAAVSFIGYRQQPVGYLSKDYRTVQRAGVIQCCSELSVYDPAEGARVLSGPAPQPLAAIALSLEEDRLYATGVYGGALFRRFFEQFGFRLALDFGEEHVQERVVDQATVIPTEEYTRLRIRC